MTRILKRQLNDSEKEHVLKQYGRRCFANNHEIPETDFVEFDHVRAFTSGGESELNNIAPMCRKHNREKGTLPLYDFRAKLNLAEFFSIGDRLTLHDLLAYLKREGTISNFALPVSVQNGGDKVTLESPNGKQDFRIHQCPITDWKYFYATLPTDLIDSDDAQDQSIGLQPRYLISDKMFELFSALPTSPCSPAIIG